MKHLILTSLIIFSCTHKTEVQKIVKSENHVKSVSIATYGGEMGYSRSMKITGDSIYYDLNIAMDSTKRKHISKSNLSYKLQNIINPDQIIRFSEVTNGKSLQPIDGTDTEITIETDKNKYSVINGWDAEIWQKTNRKMQTIITKEFGPE